MSTPVHQPLRELRRQAGLSLRELESRTGINRGRLSYLERGVDPTQFELERIMQVLVKAIRDEAPR